MKVKLYLTTHALEQIARGEVSAINLDAASQGSYYFDAPGPERHLLAEIDVDLPPREVAVALATKMLCTARATMDAYFAQRIAELQAIEGPST